jgi:predicted aspartyl protease
MRSRPYYLFLILIGLAAATQPPARGFEKPGLSPTISEASATPSRPSPMPKDTANATVRFNLYQGYLIVVRGSAGPLKNLNFFLDTGTSPSILDSRVARKLNLEEETATNIVILGGRAQGRVATLPSLELGPVERSDLHVTTADLSFLDKRIPYRIDGIIGLDVLGQSAFEIDYAARVIHFGPPPPLQALVPLQLEGGLATIAAEINDVPVHLILDTGASSMILFDKAPGSGVRVDAELRSNKSPGEFASKSVLLHTLRLGKEEFRVEPALVVHNPKQTQLDFDGLMSPAALRITRMSIDLGRGELGFSY